MCSGLVLEAADLAPGGFKLSAELLRHPLLLLQVPVDLTLLDRSADRWSGGRTVAEEVSARAKASEVSFRIMERRGVHATLQLALSLLELLENSVLAGLCLGLDLDEVVLAVLLDAVSNKLQVSNGRRGRTASA